MDEDKDTMVCWLAYGEVVGYQELELVQNRQPILSFVSLNDHSDLIGMLLTDLLDFFASLSKCLPSLERFIRRHPYLLVTE